MSERSDGSQDRQPTEGKWVAEPRQPSAPDDSDGVTRLIADKPVDDANPRASQPGPTADDLEEKIVEGGVTAAKDDAEKEYFLNPRGI